METNFEKTDIYKKAFKEYQEKVYGNILKPLHSIVINEDKIYLFYNQSIVDDIYIQLRDIYDKMRNRENTDFPFHLGSELPIYKDITFMGNKYKAISLWYDGGSDMVPNEFKAKL